MFQPHVFVLRVAEAVQTLGDEHQGLSKAQSLRRNLVVFCAAFGFALRRRLESVTPSA